MTFNQYKTMKPVDQEFMLWTKGIEIGFREDTHFRFLLYQLDAFYLEIRFNIEIDQIDLITCFEDLALLDPYLDQIDIDPILNYY